MMRAPPGNHPPSNSNVDTTPLTETRLAGERLREVWLADMAAQSLNQTWTIAEIKAAAILGARDAVAARNLDKPKAVAELVRQGRLAGHPAVRHHFERLVSLRDHIWRHDPELARAAFHGPSQMLIAMLQRQKEAHGRHHVQDLGSCLAYLRTRVRV